MNRNNHIIQKQTIEVEIERGRNFSVVQSNIKNIYYEKILPGLDNLFSEFAGDDVIIRLDKIELNLGNLSVDKLEEQLVEKTIIAAKKCLEDKMKFDVNDTTQIELIPLKKSAEDIFIYFLEFGYFPWWSRINDLMQLEEMIMDERFRNSDLSDKLRSLIGSNSFTIQRLIFQFSDNFLHFLVQLFFPSLKSKELRNEVLSFFSDRMGFNSQFLRDSLWNIIFQSLSSASNGIDLKIVKDLVSGLSNQRNISHDEFLLSISKTNINNYPYLSSIFKVIYSGYNFSFRFENEPLHHSDLPVSQLKEEEENNAEITTSDLIKEESDIRNKINGEGTEEETGAGIIDSESSESRLIKEEDNQNKSEEILDLQDTKSREDKLDKLTKTPHTTDETNSPDLENLEKENIFLDITVKTDHPESKTRNTIDEVKNKTEDHTNEKEKEDKIEIRLLKGEAEKKSIDEISPFDEILEAKTESNTDTDLRDQIKESGKEFENETVTDPESESLIKKIVKPIEQGINLTEPDIIIQKQNFLKERSKENTEIYTGLAGLVILHPFLRNYFEALKLTDGRTFFSEESLHRAIYLLGYLSTGEIEIQEQRLILPKILCGMELAKPIRKTGIINREEQEETEKLLLTVISYWSALKSTSPEGLRNTFLKREGKLVRKENTWQIDVEKKTWDILLAKLPWGFSIIQLSWMDELLFVNWG